MAIPRAAPPPANVGPKTRLAQLFVRPATPKRRWVFLLCRSGESLCQERDQLVIRHRRPVIRPLPQVERSTTGRESEHRLLV